MLYVSELDGNGKQNDLSDRAVTVRMGETIAHLVSSLKKGSFRAVPRVEQFSQRSTARCKGAQGALRETVCVCEALGKQHPWNVYLGVRLSCVCVCVCTFVFPSHPFL